MVAEFLRRKRPEIVAETGNRLEERAYAPIVKNGYERYDNFGVLDASWPTVASALPLFIGGSSPRLQMVCRAISHFLDFTGRWDEWLLLEQQGEEKAIAAADCYSAGWRAHRCGFIHYLRGEADEVLACANRAELHWQTAQAGARERSFATRLRGTSHHMKEDYPAAIAAYRESLALDRTLSAGGTGRGIRFEYHCNCRERFW